MAGVASRQGAVFVDDDVEGGEVRYDSLQQPGSPTSSSGVESEGSYAEVYSDDSYHSDGDEIAEIWDPYCTSILSQLCVGLGGECWSVLTDLGSCMKSRGLHMYTLASTGGLFAT